MELFSYSGSIRFIGFGLLVLLIGVVINKYFGFISVGVGVSFLGFGIICLGMLIWLIAWFKKLVN